MTSSHLQMLDPVTYQNVELWLTGDYDDETKLKIRKLLETNPKEIIDAFYTHLSFGTGGLRGIMGAGCNRMNVYTVRAATQGLANYLKKVITSSPAVFIGYDSRQNSKLFAEESAKVLAGNGIKVYLLSELRPTPLVSFGCRYKKCQAAIMITASHNPAQYNGYKVYWSDGGQVLPPHDSGIISEVKLITKPSMVQKAENLQHPLIELILNEVDEAYFKAIQPLQNYPKDNKTFGHNLKIVYSSLHGTGITMVPTALANWGFNSQIFVEQQILVDSSFPTAPYPNPEEPQALQMGIDLLQENGADLFIATDPDADRLGVVVRHQGRPYILTGNQIACLCIEHICKALSDQKRLPLKAGFVKSVVTTDLFKAIAEAYQRVCVDELIGFKYIAKQILNWENDPKGKQFIFGAEESLGYLLGTNCRDKDAVASAALLCEIALQAKLKGKTLIDLLSDLYIKYGVYIEDLLSVKFEESKAGREKMAKGMQILRQNTPHAILESPLIAVDDYLSSEHLHVKTGQRTPLTLPKTDLLTFWLDDGSKIMIRPSGTEPKIKIYSACLQRDFKSLESAIQDCKNKAAKLLKEVEKLLLTSF